MQRPQTGLALLMALAMLGCVPPASAQSTMERNSFGGVDIPAHAAFGDAPLDLEARVTLRPDSGYANASFLLFAFNVHSERVHVRFTEFLTSEGEPAPFHRDDRGIDAKQPKLIVQGYQLPEGGVQLVMRAIVEVEANGQFHVGVLAMGFDPNWQPLATPVGEQMLIYGFSLVSATGVERGFLDPPFEGRGNVPGLWLVPLVAIGCGAGAWWWRRRRHVVDAG